MFTLPSDYFFLYLPGALEPAFVGVGYLVSDTPKMRAAGLLLFLGGIGGILSTMGGVSTKIAHLLGV